MCIKYLHNLLHRCIAYRYKDRKCATKYGGRLRGRRKARQIKSMSEMTLRGKLVSAEQLLEQLFAPECKPSLRWLRSQTKAKSIPHVRIGHLVFFDVEMVRSALAGRNTVRGRTMPALCKGVA